MTRATNELAGMMLAKGTFQFRPRSPLRWASGYLMPVYSDNRRLLSYPLARKRVVEACMEIIERRSLVPSAIVGIATGGIAPATALADRLDARLLYVRSKPKEHGAGRQVEGIDGHEGGPALMMEDVVSTGGSSASATAAAHDAGLDVRHGVSVFSYGFDVARERFAQLSFGFTMEPIVTLDDLMGRATEQGLLRGEDLDLVTTWMTSPFTWGDAFSSGDLK